MAVNLLADDNEREKPINLLEGEEAPRETVNTAFGQLPKNIPDLTPGTAENQLLAKHMIEAGAGGPGMNFVGKNVIGFGEGIGNLFKKVVPKELAYGVQRGHDILKKKATDIYDFVKKEAAPRGVSKLPINKDLIDKAGSKLPESEELTELLNNAKEGDFSALRDLQSLLGEEWAGLKSSSTHMDRRLAPGVKLIRDEINNSIYKSLEDYGAGDLSKMLKEANGYYTKLHETYSHPTIKKMVGKNRIVPKNPMNIFSAEDERIKALHAAHPEIKNALDILEKKAKTIGHLKNLKIPAIVAGSGAGGYFGNLLIKKLLGED